ncbi:MAG: hypothetical protein Q7T54_01210 [Candidatus Levybacteria bacterium]|nr:hypothetical protein [Candidatus Levybacteria bacterium]
MLQANNKKDEGFSYTSQEKQQKNALKILSVEIIGLIVLVAGIIVAFNYLNIVSLEKIFPGFFGWLPTRYQQKPVSQLTPSNVKKIEKALDADLYLVDASVIPQIEVVSDVPLVKISIRDKKVLTQFANQFGVFGRKYYLEPGKYTQVLKKLVIHLTDQEQPNNKYFLLKKIPVSSSGLSFDGNTFHLYIFLSDEAYSNKNTSSEDFFLQNLMTTTFRMSYNPIGGKMNPDKENELISLLKKIDDYTINSIEIKETTNDE